MTYFGFLFRFVLPPLVLFAAWVAMDWRRGRRLPQTLQGWSPWAALAVHVVLAVAYTTPWDNYLVATGVWWYDRELVTGFTIGWVPIEEYTFFVLQTVLAGLAVMALARYLPAQKGESRGRLRVIAPAGLGVVWLASAVILASGWEPGRYLGLELIWALPPLMIQLAFGADIIWRHRRLALGTALGLALYLAATDSLAIGAGTWTINPQASTGVMVLGVLPIEELLFFLLTSTLVVFGMVLTMAVESQVRLMALIRSLAPGRQVRSKA
jgi:lycopene cyclase domain-containing protein